MIAKDIPEDILYKFKDSVLYEPETGKFLSIKEGSGGRYGKYIGLYIRPDGYIRMSVNKFGIYAHRLAWILYYNEQPPLVIDHIDGDRSNNKISNLRKATVSENGQNKIKPKLGNRSGFIGVKVRDRPGYALKYEAQIGINNKDIYLGIFDTPELAHAAYIEKKKELHPFFNQQ